MNEMRFEAEIVCAGVVPVEVVRERTYGGVRVTAVWPDALAGPEIRVPVTVRGDVDRRNAPAYVELFFHDLFLLLNLAVPGSFAGSISVTGAELRVHELTFSARIFDYATGLERLPLHNVVAWYDRLQIGTQQVATSSEVTALFQLLHLAREPESEEVAILRLASAAEALVGRPDSLRRLYELRDAIARGRTPAFHPMHDDALDPRVEDLTAEWIDAADEAASVVVGVLQRRIRA